MKSAEIASLFRKLSDSIPNPKTELCYQNTFELLISVILSAQATDASVNKVTPELFSAFPTPEEMFEAGSEKVFAHIRSIGLAPTKSKNIAATCGQLVKLHKGVVPDKKRGFRSTSGSGTKNGECDFKHCIWGACDCN